MCSASTATPMGLTAPVMKLWLAFEAVEVGPAHGAGGVGPVDVLGVDRHATGEGGAGDEALARVRAVEVGPADRVAGGVGPVDVLGVDRHAVGLGRTGDEALVRVRAVEVGPADRAGGRQLAQKMWRTATAAPVPASVMLALEGGFFCRSPRAWPWSDRPWWGHTGQ